MTNQQLNKAIETATEITEEITDIFMELDGTNSVATQAELNELLVKLYHRLKVQQIVITRLGRKAATPEQFKAWIDDNFDEYTKKLFHKEI